MRLARTARLLATAGAAALALGLVVDGTAQAVPAPSLVSLSFGSPSLTVSGLAMGTQMVTVRIVDPSADAVAPPDGDRPWFLELRGTGSSGTLRTIDVLPDFVSGTLADGVWRVTIHVPSTADGTWSLHDAVQCGGDCGAHVTIPPGTPTFTVAGHHQPRFSVGATPSPVAYPRTTGYVKGRVVDADTNKGMPGVTVGYATDTACVQFPPDGPIGFFVEKKTDANGYYTFGPVSFIGLQCAGIWGAVRHNSDGYSILPAFRTFSVRMIPLVSAKPVETRRSVGQFVGVNGTVRASFPGGIKVRVEQLYGRSVWKFVAMTTVRASGRWSSVAKPTVKGRNVFRAITASNPGFASGTSPSFVIIGT